MQSHQHSFGADAAKRYGHRRTPSMGKAMPVTSLLLHFPPPTSTSSLRTSGTRDGRTPEYERPPFYFQVDEPPIDTKEVPKFASKDDELSSADEISIEQEYEMLVSECSSDNGGDGGDRDHDEQISLIGNSIFYTPCLTCTDGAPGDLGTRATAINEMCRRLCTDECRLRLSLAGFEPPSTTTLKSKEALAEYVRDSMQRPQLQHTCSEDTLQSYPIKELISDKSATEPPTYPVVPRRPSHIAIQRKKFLTNLLATNATDTDSDSNFADDDGVGKSRVLDPQQPQAKSAKSWLKCVNTLVATKEQDAVSVGDDGDSGSNGGRRSSVTIDKHELAMLKDFREKFEIAEALAKASAMTSTPQIKQRLAARKLEIANANVNAKAHESATTEANTNAFAVVADVAKQRQQPQPQQAKCAKQIKQRKKRRQRQHQQQQQQKQNQQYPKVQQGAANSVAMCDALTRADMKSSGSNTNSSNERSANNNANYNNNEHYDCSDDAVYSIENYKSNSDSNDSCDGHDDDDEDDDDDDHSDCDGAFVVGADMPATEGQQQLQQARNQLLQQQQRGKGSEFEPPRDLLLYLVRMGSFNSAPKINNIDSQDDSLEIPKGLNNTELLQHVKRLRGEDQPQLLTRYFAKPSLVTQMVSTDVTDGLRSLKLNTKAREYGATSTLPNHIRVLQWNILSQTLGQNNDGFVRCPEEALLWEHRKFLIVQEILQNNPDVICLQEVDHYKFLKTILSTQNYEGIFFPKPDSPCLYIEENNGPDGCAIFYRRDKFELKQYDTRILEVWRVQSNQVAIVANLAVRATGQEVCVCTTHLKARHGALLSKLRNEQGRDLLRFVKQFGGQRPVILCGDFNAEPTEPVYATVLSCDILKLASAYAEIKAERDECNNDSENNHGDGNSNKAAETDVGEDKVQQSIACEPPYTTWKIREDGEECHTIDYVFYSQEDFKVRNCLEFPQGDEIGKNRTPSFQYPSDHFSLVCDFELLNRPQN